MAIDEYVTMREAASILGVSHAKMWQLVREGLLPAEKNPLDGRQKLIRVSDLEELKRPGSQPRPETKSPEADNGTQNDEIQNGPETGRLRSRVFYRRIVLLQWAAVWKHGRWCTTHGS